MNGEEIVRAQAAAIDDLLRLVADLRDSVDRRDVRILELEAALALAESERDEMAELACHHEDRLAQQLIDEWRQP